MKKSIRRRRLEAKTDYATRLALLSSGKPRIVIRRTNKLVIVQIVKSHIAQDEIVAQATSKDLLALGWPKDREGSLKNRAAAYLTGFVAGARAKGKIKECILDMGMNRNIHKSRIYAALKGALDAGLVVPHNDEVIPSLEMIIFDKAFEPIVEKVKKHHG